MGVHAPLLQSTRAYFLPPYYKTLEFVMGPAVTQGAGVCLCPRVQRGAPLTCITGDRRYVGGGWPCLVGRADRDTATRQGELHAS